MLAASALVASKGVWYLMRSSGVVSLVLLTGVMVLGIATANRWRPGRAPRFVTAGLHRSIALLAVCFVAVHVVTAVVDPYAMVSAVAVVVPFVGAHKPLEIGLGALSVDLVVALIVTSLLRRRLGLRVWRGVHWLAYLAWPVALFHSLGIGSDTGTLWMRAVTAGCVAAVGGALVVRLWNTNHGKRLEPQRVPRSALKVPA